MFFPPYKGPIAIPKDTRASSVHGVRSARTTLLRTGRAVMSELVRERTPAFSNVSVAIISVLLTALVAVLIAFGQRNQTTSYDRDSALIKSSIQANAQAIHDLTATVDSLAIQEAALQQQVNALQTVKPK